MLNILGRFLKLWILLSASILLVYGLMRFLTVNPITVAIVGGIILWLITSFAYKWWWRR